MSVKSILFLGAAEFQIAPIKYAYESGYKIYTCDNKKNNPGHKFAYKSFFISTLDYELIIEKIKPYKIDAVLSYGSDVSAFSAAKIAEFFNLKSNNPDSIKTLTNKVQFRQFLSKHSIQNHRYFQIHKDYLSEICSIKRDFKDKIWVLKPCDSSGSKGVSLIDKDTGLKELRKNIQGALVNSKSKILILEEFIERKGNQVCGDGYFKNGKIEFIFFGDGWSYYDQKPANFTPYAESFPSKHKDSYLHNLKIHIEKILCHVGFIEGPFNHDSLIMKDGSPFVIEIGPRNGGNFIPDAIKYLTGFNFASYTVEQSLGNNKSINFDYLPKNKYIINLMLHWGENLNFNKIKLDRNFEKRILELNISIEKGNIVNQFRDSSDYFGHVIFSADTRKELMYYLNNIKNAYRII